MLCTVSCPRYRPGFAEYPDTVGEVTVVSTTIRPELPNRPIASNVSPDVIATS